MNRTVHATAPEQGHVGRVDNGIDVESRDVSADDIHFLGASHLQIFCIEFENSPAPTAFGTLAPRQFDFETRASALQRWAIVHIGAVLSNQQSAPSKSPRAAVFNRQPKQTALWRVPLLGLENLHGARRSIDHVPFD
jgi:hypothetical protein